MVSGMVGRLRSALKYLDAASKILAHHRVFRVVAGHFRMDVHVDGANFGKVDHNETSLSMQKPELAIRAWGIKRASTDRSAARPRFPRRGRA